MLITISILDRGLISMLITISILDRGITAVINLRSVSTNKTIIMPACYKNSQTE